MPKRSRESSVSSSVLKKLKADPVVRALTKKVKAKRSSSRSTGVYGRYQGTGKERKYFNVSLNNYKLDQTAEVVTSDGAGANLTGWPESGIAANAFAITHFGNIPQGVAGCQRIGRKVVIKSIQGKAAITYGQTVNWNNSKQWTSVRIVLVQDMQANGAVPPVVTDVASNPAVFQNVQSATTLVNALPNLYTKGRYRILYDKTITFNPVGSYNPAAYSCPYQTKNISFFKRCNIPIEYDTSDLNGNIGSIRMNAITMLAGCDNSDDVVTVSGNFRVRYEDD